MTPTAESDRVITAAEGTGLRMNKFSTSHTRQYRAQLRTVGLRPIQIWIPDTHRPGFAEECQRQSLSLLGDPQEREMADWLEKAADTEGWE